MYTQTGRNNLNMFRSLSQAQHPQLQARPPQDAACKSTHQVGTSALGQGSRLTLPPPPSSRAVTPVATPRLSQNPRPQRVSKPYLVHPSQHVSDVSPGVMRVDLNRARQAPRATPCERHNEALEQRPIARSSNLHTDARRHI